ncbi:MAG: hypothetical protein ACRDV9_13940, partial [Acidimicrobiia bacterium]
MATGPLGPRPSTNGKHHPEEGPSAPAWWREGASPSSNFGAPSVAPPQARSVAVAHPPSGDPPAPANAPLPRPRGLLSYGWVLSATFIGFPVWWVLGLGAFIWPLLAFPMGFSLLTRRQPVRFPRFFGLWLLFLVWMLLSAIELDGADRMIGFVYRASLYISATVTFLFVYNAPSSVLSASRLANLMTAFWVVVVAGGLLGVLAPALEFRSPAEMLLPARLASNEYVSALVHPASAQVQTFLGYAVPRPKAPFTYTNEWGSNYALLLPFLMVSWGYLRTRFRRALVAGIVFVSLIPVFYSLNRILWVSVFVAAIYGGVHLAMRGNTAALRIVAMSIFAMIAVFALPATRSMVSDRINTPHSNTGRLILAQEAADSVGKSPLLGFGAPRPSVVNPNLPPVGTQGQFWLILFSHGFPGLI